MRFPLTLELDWWEKINGKIRLPGQSIIAVYPIDCTIPEKFHVSHTQQWSLFSPTRGAYSELGVVQVLHSDDYNATRVQYITLISHTGAQWYHN